MGTPRKICNYYSPYAQKVGQYPSQATDYMSQHAGGLQSPSTDRRQTTHNSNQNASHFYQSRKTTPQSENGGFFFYEDRQSSGEKRPHFYQNKTPQHDQRRNYGYRGGRGRGSHRSAFGDRSGNNSSSQYIHSSMLEDPWQELMERHNAIHDSVLREESSAEIDAS